MSIESWTLTQALLWARQTLHAAAPELHSDEVRGETELLLTQVLDCSRAHLIAHREQVLTDLQRDQFQSWITRRASGEPVAYILGTREFYGLRLQVNNAVLIPRPETELLVDLAIARLPLNEPCRVLDLGTGSGAIALAIAHARPHARVLACDASERALAVARANAKALLESSRIAQPPKFVLSNWFSAIDPQLKFNCIVSNPPYIEDQDPHLSQGDLRFEPRSALASGSDGLHDIRQLIGESPRHLRSGGWLLLEHGHDQGQAARDLLVAAGFVETRTLRDLNAQDRVSMGKLT